MTMMRCLNTFQFPDKSGCIQVMQRDCGYCLKTIYLGKTWFSVGDYKTYGEAVKAAFTMHPELKGTVGY